MAVCCIGGVCVPYSALIPLLLYGIKWLVGKLMEYGLLPKALHEKINQILTTTTGTQKQQQLTEENSSVANTSSSSSSTTCCTSKSSNSSLRRRGKDKKEIIVSNSSSLSCDDEDFKQQQENDCCVKELVITIESSDQWNKLFHTVDNDCNNIVICKFTADWCKPCKEINPLFTELAEQYTNNNTDTNIQFCIIDVDNDALEEVVGSLGVAILPTFCVLDSKNKPINKYTGSDRNKLKEFVANAIDNVTKIQK